MNYDRQVLREIKQWPGVGAKIGYRRKHKQVTLSFEGRTRFLVLPGTSGDSHRGVHIKIAELRRTLRLLGAERAA